MKTVYVSMVLAALFMISAVSIAVTDDTGKTMDDADWEDLIRASSGRFVSATNITGTPTDAFIGVPLPLTGTVTPSNATNQTIAWSVKDPGTTGATISDGNIFNAPAAGTATVTATIEGGTIGMIDAGTCHTAAIKDGEIWTWGYNNYG
jgi:hypothetical protein